MATTPQVSDKVEKRSVSFSPGSLAEWADEYGHRQQPVMSFSAVVCTALREFKDRKEPSDLEANVIVAAKRVGLTRALSLLEEGRRPRGRKVA